MIDRVKNPFYDALAAMTGELPPDYCKGLVDAAPLGDRVHELQTWCANHCRPEWATGLSIIEAAELIVRGAIENANIEVP